MLVEAHDSFRNMLGIYLSRKFDVSGAKNGLEAMHLLCRGFLPSVIIMDHQTAEVPDFQLLQLLRNSGLFADIPVLVMAADNSEKEDAHYHRLGAEIVVRKPFNPVKLESKLHELMGLANPAPAILIPEELRPIGRFA